MYVCLCKGITEADVRGAGARGVVAPEDLVVTLGLEDPECCGRCARDVEFFVPLACDGFRAVADVEPELVSALN